VAAGSLTSAAGVPQAETRNRTANNIKVAKHKRSILVRTRLRVFVTSLVVNSYPGSWA
jgi:hypothetical protein